MKCGLAPYNPQVMMESYAFFTDLEAVDPTAHQQVLDAIPKLAVLARESGFCTDEQMEAALGDLFALSPAFAAIYNRQVAEHAPVNHRRCIWLSNPAFLETERLHRQQKIAEAEAAAAAAANRVPRSRNQNPAPPSNHAPSVPASGFVLSWRYPCTWCSASGVVINCGSTDRKKVQHERSGAHAKFLKAVEAELALALPAAAAAVNAAANASFEAPVVEDPLHQLDLSMSSRALDVDDNSSDSDASVDIENDDDDTESVALGGGTAGTNSRGGGGAAAIAGPGARSQYPSPRPRTATVTFEEDETSTPKRAARER